MFSKALSHIHLQPHQSLTGVAAIICAAALLACSDSDGDPPEQDAAPESDTIEGDAAADVEVQTDAEPTDTTEGDVIEADSTESDTTEGDVIEADSTESDTTESDTTESDVIEADSTESDATESDVIEADSTESDVTPDAIDVVEADSTESDATPDAGDTDEDVSPTDASEDATPDVVSVCGDGSIEGDEDCDDGDANSDTEPDACRSDCTFATCGDGVIDTDEVCDDGDANSDTEPDACRSDCTFATCGDGVIDTDEVCDDGDANSDTEPDACRSICTTAACGDGVIDTDEVCDDGDNPGARVGDCIPGCSGRVVQELRMRLSLPLSGVSSDFAAGAPSFTEAADSLCPEGFKAVITDGSTRIASVTPHAGDGQVDWVLEPFTAYYDEIDSEGRWPSCCSDGFAGTPCCEDGVYTGQLVWTTDDVALLGVRRGEPTSLPGPSSIPYYFFDKSGQPIWTGFNPDWTAGPNCSGWTSASREDSGTIGNTGGRTSRVWSVTTNQCGAFTRQILCVEQPSP